MTKITAEHLARSAYVYIRQSTPGQLVHNHESRRRQYALADRARQRSGGRAWRSSTTILVDRAAVSPGPASIA
jgi:hypothetical protein